jgi:hypothetical protein
VTTKIDKHVVIYAILFAIIAFLSFQFYRLNNKVNKGLDRIEVVNEDGLHTSIYYDKTISSLKQENKELYDSIKGFKDEIDYLVQFKYKKTYRVDTVYCDTTHTDKDVTVFEYDNTEKNDSMNYHLEIASKEEPRWYRLNVEVGDQFTIVNKRDAEGLNITDIKSENKAEVSSVVVFHKKQSFWKNFSVGPSVNVGYDVLNNQVGLNVGFGVTFRINGSKK